MGKGISEPSDTASLEAGVVGNDRAGFSDALHQLLCAFLPGITPVDAEKRTMDDASIGEFGMTGKLERDLLIGLGSNPRGHRQCDRLKVQVMPREVPAFSRS